MTSATALLCVFQAWAYITWALFIYPYVEAHHSAAFVVLSGCLWFNLLKSWRGDAGVIQTSHDEKMRTIVRYEYTRLFF